MRIINKTTYDTAALKRFFAECLRRAPLPVPSKDLLVKVVYLRSPFRRSGGYAYYGKVWCAEVHESCYFIQMKIRNSTRTLTSNDGRIRHIRTPYDKMPHVRHVACTFIHEVYHCAGVGHNDMRGSYFHRNPDHERRELAWADAFEVPRAQKPVKPKPTALDRARKKLAHAEAKLKAHESKLKREQKLVRKWRAKVKYHQKRIDRLSDVRMAASV